MSAAIRPCPPFQYPADFQASAETVSHASADEHVKDATDAHETTHLLVSVPYCELCIVAETLDDPYRLGRARRRLGDLADYVDLLEVLDVFSSGINASGLKQVDAKSIADHFGIDQDTLREAVEYVVAHDELHAAWRAASGADTSTPEGYLAHPRNQARSRFTRYVRKNGGRLPQLTYDPATDDGQQPLGGYASQVAAEALRLRIRDDAKALHAAQKAAQDPAEPFDAGLLADVLARPAEPAHRVDGLIPADGSTLIVAQRKTGKTTLILNLARTLLDGGQFLGRFAVQALAGRVTILNYEVSAAQLGRWAADTGIDPQRLYLVNLRGRRNPLAHPVDRATLAGRLRELDTETLIVDPFANAYTGQSQNDAGEVGAWLRDLDLFARSEVGARDLVLTVHAGWNADRTRGASALEDWADSIVTLTKDDDDNRYLRAIGRDVDVPEDGLTFDHHTRRLVLAGSGSRKARAISDRSEFLVSAVHGIVTASPGLNGSQIEDTLRRQKVQFQKGQERQALALAVDRGLLRVEQRGVAKLYYPTPPRTSPDLPAGRLGYLPTSPYRGEGEITGAPQRLDLPDVSDGAA